MVRQMVIEEEAGGRLFFNLTILDRHVGIDLTKRILTEGNIQVIPTTTIPTGRFISL